jgi:hypothetical protein
VTTGTAQPAVEATLHRPLPVVREQLLQRLGSNHPVKTPAHPEYGPQLAQFELATNEH